jgi:hypothetical protein
MSPWWYCMHREKIFMTRLFKMRHRTDGAQTDFGWREVGAIRSNPLIGFLALLVQKKKR